MPVFVRHTTVGQRRGKERPRFFLSKTGGVSLSYLHPDTDVLDGQWTNELGQGQALNITAFNDYFPGASGTSRTTQTIAMPAGALIVVLWADGWADHLGTKSIANSGSALSWTQIAQQNNAGTAGVAGWWAIGDGTSRTITVSFATPDTLTAAEIFTRVHIGQHPTDPVPLGKVQTFTSTTDVSKSITPTNANGSALWMLAADWANTNSFAAGANCTLDALQDGSPSATFTLVRPTTQPRVDGSAFTLSETDTSGIIDGFAFEVVAAAPAGILYPSIDENPAIDSDFIKSSMAPSVDICRVQLSDPTTGKIFSTPVTVSYRYANIGAAGSSVDITVTLKQGSTQIAQWVHNGVTSSSYVTANQTLTSPQIAAISDWTSLFLEFQAG